MLYLDTVLVEITHEIDDIFGRISALGDVLCGIMIENAYVY